jgi:hypothetical protein
MHNWKKYIIREMTKNASKSISKLPILQTSNNGHYLRHIVYFEKFITTEFTLYLNLKGIPQIWSHIPLSI